MTENVDALFASKHGFDPDEIAGLDGDDLSFLAEVARGSEQPDDRAKAIALWPLADFSAAVDGLTAIVADDAEDETIRAAATAALAGAAGGDAVATLAALFESEASTPVLVEAALQMAKIGTPDVLPALDALAEATQDQAVADQARFSASVIAYRNGIAGRELPPPDPGDILIPPVGSPEIGVAAADQTDVDALTALGTVETYGISPSLEQTVALDCNGSRLLVALDPTLADDQLAGTATSRPMLLGVVARQAQDDDSYAVELLLLCWPLGPAAALAAYRPTGRQIGFGPCTTLGTFAFTLEGVRGPGAAGVSLFGTVSSAGPEFGGAFTTDSVVEPKGEPDAA